MPAWVEDRAKRIMRSTVPEYGKAKGKSIAYAIATQQGHATKKTPKTYRGKPFGTSAGRREAREKYRHPSEMRKSADELKVGSLITDTVRRLSAAGGAAPQPAAAYDPNSEPPEVVDRWLKETEEGRALAEGTGESPAWQPSATQPIGVQLPSGETLFYSPRQVGWLMASGAFRGNEEPAPPAAPAPVADEKTASAPDLREVVAFFDQNPNPTDEALHAWAEERGWDPDEVEEVVYRLATLVSQFLTGGEANKQEIGPEDVDTDQLEMGKEVEKEHSPDEWTAQRIALDHLAELPDYYSRLDAMEEEGKRELKKESTTQKEAFIGGVLRRLIGGAKRLGSNLAKRGPVPANAVVPYRSVGNLVPPPSFASPARGKALLPNSVSQRLNTAASPRHAWGGTADEVHLMPTGIPYGPGSLVPPWGMNTTSLPLAINRLYPSREAAAIARERAIMAHKHAEFNKIAGPLSGLFARFFGKPAAQTAAKRVGQEAVEALGSNTARRALPGSAYAGTHMGTPSWTPLQYARPNSVRNLPVRLHRVAIPREQVAAALRSRAADLPVGSIERELVGDHLRVLAAKPSSVAGRGLQEMPVGGMPDHVSGLVPAPGQEADFLFGLAGDTMAAQAARRGTHAGLARAPSRISGELGGIQDELASVGLPADVVGRLPVLPPVPIVPPAAGLMTTRSAIPRPPTQMQAGSGSFAGVSGDWPGLATYADNQRLFETGRLPTLPMGT